MELAKTWSLPYHSNSGFFPHIHSQRPPLEVALTLIQSEEQDVEAQAGHQGTQRHLPPTTQRVLITRRPERQPNPDMRKGGAPRAEEKYTWAYLQEASRGTKRAHINPGVTKLRPTEPSSRRRAFLPTLEKPGSTAAHGLWGSVLHKGH